MIISHSNKYFLSLLANRTLRTAMSEKEKEAQVSENETKGENFFFKHECTFIQQFAGKLVRQSIAEKFLSWDFREVCLNLFRPGVVK